MEGNFYFCELEISDLDTQQCQSFKLMQFSQTKICETPYKTAKKFENHPFHSIDWQYLDLTHERKF